jgi:hypothetical protein
VSHTERSSWRDEFREKIEEFYKKENSSPLLQHLWRKAMTLWLTAETPDIQLPINLFSVEVAHVITQQNAIGWRQVFNGRFAITWSSVQEDYLGTRATNVGTSKHRKQTGQQWQHRLILEIWKQWIELWKLRNARLHGNNLMTQRAAIRCSADNELVALYDVSEQMEPKIARALMFNDAQDHLQQQHRNTRNWLQTNAPILHDSLRLAKRKALAGVRSIRSYFGLVR